MTLSERFWSKVRKNDGDGCWLWTASRSRGPSGFPHYGTFKLNGREHEYAHRTSWRLERGPIPDGLKVLHKCDTPACVRPDHLFLGTQTENMRDMYNKGRGRKCRGEKHPAAKFTDDQIAEIRRLRAAGVGPKELGERFGISPGYVWKLVNNFVQYKNGTASRSA